MRITKSSPGSLLVISSGTTRASEQLMNSVWGVGRRQFGEKRCLAGIDVVLEVRDAAREVGHGSLPSAGAGSVLLFEIQPARQEL
ncbi:hypothetical protein ACFU44_10740 [Nocardia rhizosphaerihabitans]|uniref:hypothetical protein n=1 Tax=Nocardia rhizosphaerihabitans TaxID=1691570 RepID=UPI00367344AC